MYFLFFTVFRVPNGCTTMFHPLRRTLVLFSTLFNQSFKPRIQSKGIRYFLSTRYVSIQQSINLTPHSTNFHKS